MSFKSISSLNLDYLQAVASPGPGTFFSLFHKHRHSTRISPSEKSVEIVESPEKSIQNQNTESILDKIRMASLASVASSMNVPTQKKVSDVSGQRQQRRTGRRNDKFLSLWQDKTTKVRKGNLILISYDLQNEVLNIRTTISIHNLIYFRQIQSLNQIFQSPPPKSQLPNSTSLIKIV